MSSFNWLGGFSGSPTTYSTAGNWSPSGPATTGDRAIFDNNAAQSCNASDQSASTLAELLIKSYFVKLLGGAVSPLQIGATVWKIHEPSLSSQSGLGSRRINFDTGTTAGTGYVYGSNNDSIDANVPPIRWKGTSGSNKIYVLGGRLGIAVNAVSDAATLSELNVNGSTANVVCGAGLTWTTVQQNAGALLLNSGGATLSQTGGASTIQGAGAIATMTLGGKCKFNMRAASGATITNLELLPGAELDLSDLPTTVAIGTIKRHKNTKIIRNAENPAHLVVGTWTWGGGAFTESTV